MEQISYDNLGRMKYHSEYHLKTGTAWGTEDIQYLIKYYDKIGSVEMSLALDRTETSVMQKVNTLRKEGIMIKPKHKNYVKRNI